MILRQEYVRVTRNIIEKDTKNRIEGLQIKLGKDNLEYEEKYKIIIQEYEHRILELLPLTF